MAIAETRDAAAVVNGRLVRAYIYAALLGILIPLFFALILAAKFIWPDLLGDVAWLQFGRLRVFHTNGVIFGWLGLSFFALLNYIVPKMSNRMLLSERLAWWTLGMLILAMGTGLTAILVGQMQAIEYAEFPWYADILFAAGFLMASINYLGTIFRTLESGVPGTAMAAFPQLSAGEKAGVAHYVQTLIAPHEVQP